MTGDPWDGPEPGCDVVCGGRLLTEDGSEELGADVIYLAPDRVKLCADHLAGTPFRAVAARFDPAAMVNAGVQDAGHLDLRARDRVLEPAYTALTRLFAAAATEGQPIYKTMSETPDPPPSPRPHTREPGPAQARARPRAGEIVAPCKRDRAPCKWRRGAGMTDLRGERARAGVPGGGALGRRGPRVSWVWRDGLDA
ncbi:DUF1877 family protein [Actinomadura yumaensis]|uniref:DUF1877 family protein n=1 Tax=Actinomadura yumaensis TaxID=111807 RepID=UPI003612DE79